jgi:penicillin-binding protein-related factor A (putative recombinase)
MREANMQTLFGQYLKEHLPEQNEVYELKMTSGNSIPFDAVKDHQVENLRKAEEKDFYHRIADQPVFYGMKRRFTIQKPFDCLSMTKSKAYVVVWFYKPRKKKVFIKMRIEDFLRMKKYSKRKSFTEEMALKVGKPIPLTSVA